MSGVGSWVRGVVVPVSSGVRRRVQQFLEPGEEIRYVFPAVASAQLTGGGGPEFILVVTRSSIVGVRGGWWFRGRPKELWRRFPRNTRLGPVDTTLVAAFRLGGLLFEVDDEYVAVINAADAEIVGVDALPPDPLPDL